MESLRKKGKSILKFMNYKTSKPSTSTTKEASGDFNEDEDSEEYTEEDLVLGALDVADKLLKRKDKTQMSDSFMKEFMKDEIVLQLDRVDGKLGEYVSCKAGRTTGILRIMPDGSRKKMISIAKVDKNTNT